MIIIIIIIVIIMIIIMIVTIIIRMIIIMVIIVVRSTLLALSPWGGPRLKNPIPDLTLMAHNFSCAEC